MLAVCASGRILNPKTARSQVIGAMTMGVGAALVHIGMTCGSPQRERRGLMHGLEAIVIVSVIMTVAAVVWINKH